jgi:hypothetical protein
MFNIALRYQADFATRIASINIRYISSTPNSACKNIANCMGLSFRNSETATRQPTASTVQADFRYQEEATSVSIGLVAGSLVAIKCWMAVLIRRDL